MADPVTPAERIRWLRREHVRTDHPVACCRKDHQNWPCDVIKALDAGAAAEREHIRQLAREVHASYYGGTDEHGPDIRQFSDLIGGQP